MSYQAPSEGTKVAAGANDRKIQEGPGVVQPDSLAAESEAFQQANNTAETENTRQQNAPRAPGSSVAYTQPGSMPRETGSNENSSAETAPSYVNNQFRSDASGPHGRNITEDDDLTRDNAKNASFNAEIGSRDDPSLLAVRKINQANATAPGSGSSDGEGRSAADGTVYDALRDQEA